MLDSLLAFQGQSLTVTGPDAGQCTAIAHKWEQICGLPIVYGDAIDTYANAGAGYTKIKNTPAAVPQAGDIIVWGQNAQIGTGAAGHTSVCLPGANVNTFTSFDQDWPTGSVCHQVTHSYVGVIGWFRPNVAINNGGSGVANVSVSQEQIDAWLHGPDGIDHWKITAFNLGQDNDALKQQISTLQAQIADQQKQIDDLKAQVAAGGSGEDSVQLNSLGAALRWMIARLGLK